MRRPDFAPPALLRVPFIYSDGALEKDNHKISWTSE